MARLPLAAFPLVEDFEVRLETMIVEPGGASPFGYHVVFFSEARGYIAGFPWWDHAERALSRSDFSIPLGDFEHPYSNLEQSWDILIHDAQFLTGWRHDPYI